MLRQEPPDSLSVRRRERAGTERINRHLLEHGLFLVHLRQAHLADEPEHRRGQRLGCAHHGLKYGSRAIALYAASELGEDAMRQSVSLSMSNQTTPLMSVNCVSSDSCISAIHAALSPPSSAEAVSGSMIGFT